MKTMKRRLNSLLMAAGMFVTATVAVARTYAEEASFLSAVPDEASLVVYAPNYAAFEKQSDDLVQAIGFLAPKMADMRAMMGLNNGINMNGAVGLIMYDFSFNNPGGPPMVIVASVSDYSALVSSLGGDAASGDINEINLMGSHAYIRKVPPNWAVMGPDKDLVSSYQPPTTKIANKATRLAPGVRKTAESGTLSILMLDMSDVSKALEEAQSISPMGMNPQMQAQQEALKEVMDQVDSGVLTLNSSQLGLTINIASAFKPGSELYTTSGKVKTGGKLFHSLPAEPCMFAMAMDASVMDFLEPFQKMSGNTKISTMVAKKLKGQLNSMETGLYIPPAGIMGGLLTRGVTVNHCKDVDKTYAVMTDMIDEMDGEEIEGIKYRTSFTPDAVEVGDQKVAKYNMNMIFPPEMAQASQAMMMLFGGPGPNGYIAKGESAVVQTLGSDSTILEATLENLKGGTKILTDQPGYKAVADQLPEDRVIEGYIGVGDVMRMAVPMVAMMMGGAQIDIPANLPPVGFSSSVSKGEASGTMFVPVQVMQAVYGVVQDLKTAMQPQMEDDSMQDEEEESPF